MVWRLLLPIIIYLGLRKVHLHSTFSNKAVNVITESVQLPPWLLPSLSVSCSIYTYYESF